MPLPSPRDKEKKSDFMSRCMLDLSKKGEFKEGKQRVAVCMSQFDKGVSEASVVVGEEEQEWCWIFIGDDIFVCRTNVTFYL